MRKFFILSSLLFSVLLLTGCNLKKTENSTEAEIEVDNQEKKEETYSGKIEKLMGLGLPLKCSWKKDDNYFGETWVKGSNFYSEVTQAGKKASIIWKDDCLWVWGEEENKEGTKICPQADQQTENEENQKNELEAIKEQAFQPADMDYQCRPAVFGDEKFDLPEGIEFLDLNALMQNFGN